MYEFKLKRADMVGTGRDWLLIMEGRNFTFLYIQQINFFTPTSQDMYLFQS